MTRTPSSATAPTFTPFDITRFKLGIANMTRVAADAANDDPDIWPGEACDRISLRGIVSTSAGMTNSGARAPQDTSTKARNRARKPASRARKARTSPEPDTAPAAHPDAPDLDPARALLAAGFKLVKLKPNTKKPHGNDWRHHVITEIDPAATGYGMLLEENSRCSIDPDNVEQATSGLHALGFDLETLMQAGVRTASTRPDSGGRSVFTVPTRVRRITFKTSKGVALELNMGKRQDVVPGLRYMLRDGSGPYTQHYCNGATYLDDRQLPSDFITWWQRLSTDDTFRKAQQRAFALACGDTEEQAREAVAHCDNAPGTELPFKSVHRMAFNRRNKVPDILIRHNYSTDGKRWAPPTATGDYGVREIPGKTDLWQSDHASDALLGTFDAWCAFVTLDHRADLGAAEAAFGAVLEHEQANTQAMFAKLAGKATPAEAAPAADGAAVGAAEAVDPAARREAQRAENRSIGDTAPPMPSKWPAWKLADMLQHCYSLALATPSTAVILDNRVHVWPNAAFATHFAHCKTLTEGQTPTGKPTKKYMPIAQLWFEHADRKRLAAASFAIGHPRLLTHLALANGQPVINLWTPTPAVEATHPRLPAFIEHVQYLFGNRAAEFLQWLAHIEQRPGVLPHRGWLNIALTQGIGRNLLASILVRLWPGEVAASLDMQALIGSSFNSRIAGKRLAIVDEIHTGSHGLSRFTVEAKMRQIMTAETRVINGKFATEFDELNAMRWLIFSNHPDALPIDPQDRRHEVVFAPTEPRPEAYYADFAELVLHDPGFIAAVKWHLATMDIRTFNSGKRAETTDDKRKAINASRSGASRAVAEWLHDNPDRYFATAGQMLGSDVNDSSAAGWAHIVREHGLIAIRCDGQRRFRIGYGHGQARIYATHGMPPPEWGATFDPNEPGVLTIPREALPTLLAYIVTGDSPDSGG